MQLIAILGVGEKMENEVENTVEEMRGLQEEIMVNSMSLVVPDVKISVESTISPRYCK